MPEIGYGNREGRYFTQWRFDDLTRLVGDLDRSVPGCSNFKIWCNDREDFHTLEFDLEGHHYQVDYYKVFAVTQDGRDSYLRSDGRKTFGRSPEGLVAFFEEGKHRTWFEKSPV